MIEAALIALAEARAALLALAAGGAAPRRRERRSVRNAYILFCALYCLVWSLVVGAIMYAVELGAGTPRSYVDSLFTIASAASSTGLLTLDTASLQLGSDVLVALTMLFCANTLLITAVPALFRICRARAARARCDATSAALVRRVTEHAERYSMGIDVVRARLAAKQPLAAPLLASLAKEADPETVAPSTSTTLSFQDGNAGARGSTTGGDAGAGAGGIAFGIAGGNAGTGGGSGASANAAATVTDVAVELVSLPGRRGSRRASAASAIAAAPASLEAPAEAASSSPDRAAALEEPRLEATAQSLSQDKIEQGLLLAAEASLRAEIRANDAHAAILRGLEEGTYLLGQWWIWWLAVAYYIIVMGSCFFALWAHFVLDPSASSVLAAPSNPATNNVHPAFVSAYLSVALFTNTGFSLLADNLIQFGSNRFVVITASVITTLGFSLYPMGLRIFVLAAHAACPAQWGGGRHKSALRDILDNPRSYATHLFSAKGTWASTGVALAMTFILLLFFLVFNFPDTYFRTIFPAPDVRAMNGWFSAIMVYNAGFNTFDLSMMDVGSQVFMMLCMWLTGRPFAVGIVTTASESHVLENAAAGGAEAEAEADNGGGAAERGVAASIRATAAALLQELFYSLRSDLLVLVICTLMICMYDNVIMTQGPYTGPNTIALGTGSYVGAFPVAFDLSSAYGNVGLSLGYPGTVVSTSGALSPFSKLVVTFMCMHGYCMGIFPSAVAALELPPGVEDGTAEDDSAGGAGAGTGAAHEAGVGANAAEDPNVAVLKAAGDLLSELTPMQLLGICHVALSSPLALARASSTQALTPAQARAGAGVAALERRLTEDGKLALIALIAGSRAAHTEPPPATTSDPGKSGAARDGSGEDASQPPPLPRAPAPAAPATPIALFLGEHFLAGSLEAAAAERAANARSFVRRRASVLGEGGGGGGTIGLDSLSGTQRRARPGITAGLAGQRGRPAAAPTARSGPRGT